MKSNNQLERKYLGVFEKMADINRYITEEIGDHISAHKRADMLRTNSAYKSISVFSIHKSVCGVTQKVWYISYSRPWNGTDFKDFPKPEPFEELVELSQEEVERRQSA